MSADEQDAMRYRALRLLVEKSVCVEILCNMHRLDYHDEPPHGEHPIDVTWYPDTPVGFKMLCGGTLDDVVDRLIREKP